MLQSILNRAKRATGFDAGRSTRRLKSLPTSMRSINTLIRTYGKTVLARSRYLAQNNPYASNARASYISALVGTGLKPSALVPDRALKEEIQWVFNEWAIECDADGITDFYGIQSLIAGEMFDAGECFVRMRPRRASDGLLVPLQLQLLPAEMLPLDFNEKLPNGNTIQSGIEFDRIGKRVAYHFLRVHPNSDQMAAGGEKHVRVPAEEVLHLFKPIQAGQIRGIPHTLSAIYTLAIIDSYQDAELERKRMAALFAGFITSPSEDPDDFPLEEAIEDDTGHVALEPGAMVNLLPGEDVKFSDPADVGGNHESFLYTNLLKAAAGFGIPYAAMTGDLRSVNYSSIRAGMVEYRRRIEPTQKQVMIHQFCRPVWRRFMQDAVLSQSIALSPSVFENEQRLYSGAKWHAPRWEWVDPLKDLQAEKLSVESGFKARSDVIESTGQDPEEVDRRIQQDQERASELGLNLGSEAPAAQPAEPNGDTDE